jgi:hypothetical protein
VDCARLVNFGAIFQEQKFRFNASPTYSKMLIIEKLSSRTTTFVNIKRPLFRVEKS